MVERINVFRVALLPQDISCSALTEQNADFFYTAEYYSAPILKEIVAEFEDALKKESGLVGKVLKEQKERTITRGDLTFTVTATPSTKTSYMEVGRAIDQYLTDLQSASDSGIKREGIRRIDEQPHISIDEVVGKMQQLIAENSNPCTGFSIDYTKMREDPAKTLKLIAVQPGTFGKVTEENAKAYRLAKEQLKLMAKKVTGAFKDVLKQETGYSVDNLPPEMAVDSFGVGRYIFMVKTIPKTDVEYGKAAKDFIQHLQDCQETSEGVKERDGMDYVAIKDLVEEYRALLVNYSKPVIEQRIELLPNPVFDQVLVKF